MKNICFRGQTFAFFFCFKAFICSEINQTVIKICFDSLLTTTAATTTTTKTTATTATTAATTTTTNSAITAAIIDFFPLLSL